MPSSSRKPATFAPPDQPAAYCPRAVVRSSRRGSATAASTFCFSMPQAVGVERRRLLHRDQRHQLEQVVLDHVAGGADAVVVAGPAADADVLGHRDLHVVDVVGVPDRLEHRRWRTASPGCSGPSPCRGSGRSGRPTPAGRPPSRMALSSRADSRSWPNGFSTTTRRQASPLGSARPCSLSWLDDVAEELRRDREVEGVVAVGAADLVELLDGAPQVVEGDVVVEVAGHEPEALGELPPDLLAELGAGVLLDRVVDDLREVLVGPVAAGEADEAEARAAAARGWRGRRSPASPSCGTGRR